MAEDEGTPLVEGERKYGATSWFGGGEEEAEAAPTSDTSWLGKLRKTAHENVEGTIGTYFRSFTSRARATARGCVKVEG